ncbi:hypothetical protein BGX31_004629 [Mortierella sp. GBA43]|nr:hypothetical protein BGX31_004629 [Mortierella sp. GBA43]
MDDQECREEAKAFYKKAQKFDAGILEPGRSKMISLPGSIDQSIKDAPLSTSSTQVTKPTPILLLITLLKDSYELDDILDRTARNWVQSTKNEQDGDRLKTLATNVVRAFKRDELKDAKAVAEADDLVNVLQLLSTRLRETHKQSPEYQYQLTMAVSRLLDAMADASVKGLDREKLHEPLLAYLEGLKGSQDTYLVYQAAYAY